MLVNVKLKSNGNTIIETVGYLICYNQKVGIILSKIDISSYNTVTCFISLENGEFEFEVNTNNISTDYISFLQFKTLTYDHFMGRIYDNSGTYPEHEINNCLTNIYNIDWLRSMSGKIYNYFKIELLLNLKSYKSIVQHIISDNYNIIKYIIYPDIKHLKFTTLYGGISNGDYNYNAFEEIIGFVIPDINNFENNSLGLFINNQMIEELIRII